MKELDDLDLDPIPQGWTVVGAVVLVKCLDEDGDPTWSFRTSDQVSEEEVLGALMARVDLQRRWLLESYSPSDD